ncbi:PIN domain-containing protein [Desulfofundulus australicus DSM 11792]|uniref:PIN domain-containing protein n=1 Tax=Desulfofundulus australicus DSM 11792 TaxID=1121425 RepID=A0A1M5DM93_9FIRM|nr:PIN domain-containing protein [Desulfofundulus australicus]SHF68103.1 PIN domain-containing protein [Desulfofundulus australicus DSM 11792]
MTLLVDSSAVLALREIIKKYRDKDFSFTDATSFAVMYRYGINLAFTFDRHFKQYGFETVGI